MFLFGAKNVHKKIIARQAFGHVYYSRGHEIFFCTRDKGSRYTPWVYIFFIMHFVFVTIGLRARDIQYRFDLISIKDGLSQVTITSIVQDSKGFLWFGTEDGLNRYDGYDFLIFRPQNNNPKSISNNSIWALFLDSDKRLWVGTYEGLNKYNNQTESFTRYYHNPNDPNSLCNNYVKCIAEESRGILWIGTNAGLSRFDVNKGQFTNFFSDFFLGNNTINIVHVSSPEEIWIGTDNGLYKYGPKAGTFKLYSLSGKGTADKIFSIKEDEGGILWVGTQDSGLIRFDKNTGGHHSYLNFLNIAYGKDVNNIRAIYDDNEGVLWLATYGGYLNLFNKRTKEFVNLSEDPLNPYTFKGNKVLAMYKDNTGVLWISTYAVGLNKYAKEKSKFSYTQQTSVSACFYEDGLDVLWIGTVEGLKRWERKNNTLKTYKYKPNDPNSISNNYIRSIIRGKYDNTLLIGTYGGGVNEFNNGTEKFYRYTIKTSGTVLMDPRNIRALYIDSKGLLWIGTDGGGLYTYNFDTKAYTQYYSEIDGPTKLRAKRIFSVREDVNKDLWITTFGEGVAYYNRAMANFTYFKNIPGDETSISHNYVLTTYESRDGSLWFGTDGYGLEKFDRGTKSFTHYKSEDPSFNNTVYGILEDKNGNLWFSCNMGVAMFDVKRNVFAKNYTIEDGLQSNEFIGNSFCKSKDGEFFFGGVKGIVFFYPEKIREETYFPSVVLTSFVLFNSKIKVGEKIKNRVLLERSISGTKKMILDYDENFFSFEFSGLHYVAPQKIKYAYRLEGLDPDWRYTNAERRYSSYTNVPPGEYKFEVKATSQGGIWGENPTVIKIIVLPPFWETWWFRGISLFFIIASIIILVQLRIRSVQLQKKKLEILVEERTKELKESNVTKDKFISIISHDLKSPFNALLGFSELLVGSSRTLTKEKIDKFNSQIYASAKQLYNLIENLLAWSRAKSEKIKVNPELINLKEVVQENISLLILTTDKKNIKLTSEVPEDTTVYADSNLISAVLRNLLSNAIKFSNQGGAIKVLSYVKNGYIEVSVKDTGVGMSEDEKAKLFREDIHFTKKGTEEEKGTGLGLLICKEFVEKSGGKIWVDSKQGEGTSFTFTIPLGNPPG